MADFTEEELEGMSPAQLKAVRDDMRSELTAGMEHDRQMLLAGRGGVLGYLTAAFGGTMALMQSNGTLGWLTIVGAGTFVCGMVFSAASWVGLNEMANPTHTAEKRMQSLISAGRSYGFSVISLAVGAILVFIDFVRIYMRYR